MDDSKLELVASILTPQDIQIATELLTDEELEQDPEVAQKRLQKRLLDNFEYDEFSEVFLEFFKSTKPKSPVTKAIALFQGENPSNELVQERLAQQGLIVELFRATGLTFKDEHIGGTEHSTHFEHLYPLCFLTAFWDFQTSDWKAEVTTEQIEAFIKENEIFYHRITFEAYTVLHDVPKPHVDILFATFDFGELSVEKSQQLLEISKSITVNPLTGYVTAGCHFMGASIVSLFLCKAVLEGLKTSKEAKRVYGKYIMKAAQENSRACGLLYSVGSRFFGEDSGALVFAQAMPFTRMLETALFLAKEQKQFQSFVEEADRLIAS